MAHLPQRWLGIVLRVVRGYYPEAEIAAWGALVERSGGASSGTAPSGGGSTRGGLQGRERLELVLVDPGDPDPDRLVEIRREIELSDLPVPCDLRALVDLTIREQDEVLDRGIRFGG